MTVSVDHLRPLLAQLSLDDKVALVRGADFWTTVALPHIGLRAMVLSDGPAGVRGPRWDEREPSLNLPSATALASSWDPDLAYRFGAAAAFEARRKGVDVVLGPTINLHRSPLGGRHFECFSEDPILTGELAASYVRGLQDNGVAATPKHYVANDSETDRYTVNVNVDERALRELYLYPFEKAVEAGAWALMSAYNSVGGVTMSENDLLETPLNSEWGFDGTVVSDWTGVRTLDSVAAAQDLAMPGPAPAWADLAEEIRGGRIDEEHLDRKVLRLLLLAERVGALGEPARTPALVDGEAFARAAAIEGAVLVANRSELPWNRDTLSRVAVIGQNARDARTQGGGSATVIPEHVVTPLDGIRAALGDDRVTFDLGAVVQEGVSELPLSRITNPRTGEPGVLVRFIGENGEELFVEDRRSTALVWFGGDAPILESSSIELTTHYTPEETGVIQLGFSTARHGRVWIDGALVIDDQPVLTGTDLGAAFLAPPSLTAAVEVTAGATIEIRSEFDTSNAEGALAAAFSVTLGVAPDNSDGDALIARAVASAAAADAVLLVVGTNSVVESEGYDRENLDLPGRQDELVAAVAAVNPRTVVVVNSGAPVLMPWRDDVAAVLIGWFGGQEFGTAIRDILFGDAEPGGRLTTTWPAALADVPVLDVTPTNGALDYTESINIGYRAWLAAGTTPAFPFGAGLGYTTWSIDSAVRETGAVRVAVTNTGARAGKHVVQVYASRADSSIARPQRWLVGFAAVRLEAGASTELSIALEARSFANYDGGWALESGEFTLHIGSAIDDTPLTLEYAPEGLA